MATDSGRSGTELNTRDAAARGAVANAGWNAFSTMWSIAISFLIAPLLIHNMGTDQYGILLLIWSVTGILGLVGFGFGEATLRYMAMYFGKRDLAGVGRVIGATLTFYAAVCSVVCLVLFAGAPMLAGAFNIPEGERTTVTWLLRLAAVVFAFRVLSLSYGAVPMALHRYDVSSKVSIVQSVVRSAGYIALAIAGFGIGHIVVWDAVVQGGTLLAQIAIARRIAPGVTLMPSMSFSGLREIVGFSVFSFLTYAFHMMQREAGKLVLGVQAGPAPVAYLATPDNVAQRLHMVVASGSETLMPRFSANPDPESTRAIFRYGSWSSLAVSLMLLVPFTILLPDFLALWISPEFARESAVVGQLVACSYISQGAYAPTATYFRGSGRPGVVTAVIAFAGIVTLAGSALMIPRYGVIGAGYAYLLGSVPAAIGFAHGWFHLLGRTSLPDFLRLICLPLAMSAISAAAGIAMRAQVGAVGWMELLVLGAIVFGLGAALIISADFIASRQNAPSRQFFDGIRGSRTVAKLRRLMHSRRSR